MSLEPMSVSRIGFLITVVYFVPYTNLYVLMLILKATLYTLVVFGLQRERNRQPCKKRKS